MDSLKEFTLVAFVCLCVGVLAGCGGGGDGAATVTAVAEPPAPAPPASAPIVIPDSTVTSVFGATLAGSVTQDFIVVVRDDGSYGEFFGVYGTSAHNDFKVAGLVTGYGNGAPGPGSYHYAAGGVDTKDGRYVLNFNLVLDPSIPSISGTITSPSEARMVAGGAIPSSAYKFNAPAILDAIRGHWALTTEAGVALVIDIGADGVVQGTLGLCTLYDSAIKPSISGKNVFALALRAQSGQFACEEPGGGSDGVYGFALAYPSVGGGTQLVIGAENGWDPVFLAAAGKR
jgi:hypothetical protein